MRKNVLEFTVPPEWDGSRADRFLRGYCAASAAMLTRLKRVPNGITQDGELLRSVDKVYSGGVVRLILPEDENAVKPVKGSLDIVYEDERLIIINKPCNMPVHPTKVHQENTLANYLRSYMLEKGEDYTFRALNRLDKDTSGVVLIAKDAYCAAKLGNTAEKEYFAVCEGEILSSGTVNFPIKKREDSLMVRTVSPDGAPCITHYEPVKHENGHTLLRLRLETGRTHQIRCHMASIGHPLAGDDLYGGGLRFMQRQALHCKSIKLAHPVSGRIITADTELPDDFFIK